MGRLAAAAGNGSLICQFCGQLAGMMDSDRHMLCAQAVDSLMQPLTPRTPNARLHCTVRCLFAFCTTGRGGGTLHSPVTLPYALLSPTRQETLLPHPSKLGTSPSYARVRCPQSHIWCQQPLVFCITHPTVPLKNPNPDFPVACLVCRYTCCRPLWHCVNWAPSLYSEMLVIVLNILGGVGGPFTLC